MVLSDLLTMHYQFIMKPNPYVPRNQAEAAHTKLVVAEAAALFSVLSLSLSLLKIFPGISLNSAFKKFTILEFVGAVGFLGWYCWDIYKLKQYVPV
jgi:hypothetical protein